MRKITFFTVTAALMIFATSCGQSAQKQGAEPAEDPKQEKAQGEPTDEYESNPAPPPPDIVVGTWEAPVKRGHVAYLEIFADGMAGLYLGDADTENSEVYEIYRGTVLAVGENADEISMAMDFQLNWYIYESDGGDPIIIPDSYKGTYTLRHEREGDKRTLHVKANDNTDPLFGKKELKMVKVPKNLQGSCMVDN